MILGLFTISGHSMLPALSPQDKVLASSIPFIFFPPKKGDIILFRVGKKLVVKRIQEIQEDGIVVAGDNIDDSLYNLTIRKKDIVGKIIFKIP